MIFAVTTLISALSISCIAAYFSIIGLATIFPGSMYAVIAMGSVLEVGKIIASIWLHKNWKSAPRMIKFYLFSAIIVLMGITSMGIFGFLSKSHIEHEQTAEKSKALVSQVESKIERQREYIQRQKDLILKKEEKSENLGGKTSENIKLEQEKISQLTNQLDKDISIDNETLKSLNNKLSKLDKELNDLKNKSGGLFSSKKKDIESKTLEQKIERENIAKKIKTAEDNISKQRAETSEIISSIRKRIQEYQSLGFEDPGETESKVELFNINISKALDEIDELEQEKFNYSDGTRQLEAEVGPIKYVAEFISDITGSSFDISKAVRIVILILIFVFDPLAILLVLAAHISLSKRFPNATIDEETYIKKTAQLHLKEKEIKSKELELKERKRDVEEDSKIMELHETQSKIFQEEISKNKEILRKVKIETEKELIKKESTSEITLELENLQKEKVNVEKEIKEIRIKKGGLIDRADEAIKSAKEIKEVLGEHARTKEQIQQLKSDICISGEKFESLKKQIRAIELENKQLKAAEAPEPNIGLKNKITQLIDQKNDLLEQNLELKSSKMFVIKTEALPQNKSKLLIPSIKKGHHEYSKEAAFSEGQILMLTKVSRELDDAFKDLDNENLKRLYELKIKKIIDPRCDNATYRQVKPEYKFIP
tara:strand:- start:2008 stop:3978 length:1971 start_codon:yes stop_codon:yes gene_type:complete